MFKHLKLLDDRLYERYLTIEKNVKSASNSFYDAYLDFLEHFVKTVVTYFNLDVTVKASCGELLRRSDVNAFFKDNLKLSDYVYGKMQDYTLKVNSHKHKLEKNVVLDTVINYMRVAHESTAAFAKYKNVEVNDFDCEYLVKIFGLFEKENEALKNEMNKLRSDLEESVNSGKLKDDDLIAYKSLLSQSEIDKLDLEEQNEQLYKQIVKLKDIKLSSMEEKLNKTITLLDELTESVIENRAFLYVIGDSICGIERFEHFKKEVKEKFKI